MIALIPALLFNCHPQRRTRTSIIDQGKNAIKNERKEKKKEEVLGRAIEEKATINRQTIPVNLYNIHRCFGYQYVCL